MNFFVYVLYSENFSKTYTGYTSHLINRFKSHNELATKGFTLKYRPWKLILVEGFDSKSEALAREKFYKSGHGRLFIQKEVIPMMIRIGFISA